MKYNLPELNGTEKQIKFANDLRAKYINSHEKESAQMPAILADDRTKSQTKEELEALFSKNNLSELYACFVENAAHKVIEILYRPHIDINFGGKKL